MDHFLSLLYGLFASASITHLADGSMMIQSAPGRYIQRHGFRVHKP
jgi:hypothetical protein